MVSHITYITILGHASCCPISQKYGNQQHSAPPLSPVFRVMNHPSCPDFKCMSCLPV